MSTDEEIKEVLREVLREHFLQYPSNPHTISELCKYTPTTHKNNDIDDERRVLAVIYNLFRKGYLAWGYNFKKPTSPDFRITDRGKKWLKGEI